MVPAIRIEYLGQFLALVAHPTNKDAIIEGLVERGYHEIEDFKCFDVFVPAEVIQNG